MNIIEAVKSGKKFKRRAMTEWLDVLTEGYCLTSLSEQSLVADDWEIDEEPKPKKRVFLWEYLSFTGLWTIDSWCENKPKDTVLKWRKSPLCPEGREE